MNIYVIHYTKFQGLRFIPATRQQDHLTLLTQVLLSHLSTGQTAQQLVTFEHDSVFAFTLGMHQSENSWPKPTIRKYLFGYLTLNRTP